MTKMEEICSVSFADHEAASELLREFTGKEGGLATVDWYLLRNKIADAISMTRVDEREKCRQLLSEKWQPMNIAPLDGTEIFIRTKDGCVSCAWDSADQEWVAGWLGIGLLKGDPLGWMPLHKHEMYEASE